MKINFKISTYDLDQDKTKKLKENNFNLFMFPFGTSHIKNEQISIFWGILGDLLLSIMSCLYIYYIL